MGEESSSAEGIPLTGREKTDMVTLMFYSPLLDLIFVLRTDASSIIIWSFHDSVLEFSLVLYLIIFINLND